MVRRHLMVALAALLVPAGLLMAQQQPQWLVKWEGVGRPGPENLAFTTGWPVDPPGFEQHDPNNCYDPPGPDYAEAANVVLGGYLAIQNLMDGTCTGIGHVDEGACNSGGLLQTRQNPCGMRYQVGPRTVLNFWGPENPEIVAYHGPNNRDTFLNGLTAEISFYIAASPQFDWTNLIEIEGYPDYDNPWNTGGGSYSSNHYCKVMLRHFMPGRPENEWHLVAEADNTFDLGLVSDYMNRWVTVRLALAHAPGKPQMLVWIDGRFERGGTGWDALGQGNDNGTEPHGYCRFGYSSTDGDVRIGAMGFTNEGVFSPLPRGQCVGIFGEKYLRPLPPVMKTVAVPEVCDNGVDDDGDGLADCEDPQCFQNRSTCNNILVNGSFEKVASPCEVETADCAAGTAPSPEPEGWHSIGSGTAHHQGDQWIPSTPSTDGPTRASVSSGSSPRRAYQSINVVAGTPVNFKGDIASGHSAGMQVQHYIRLLDGDEDSANVIDEFVEMAHNLTFHPVALSGTVNSGLVTVVWGHNVISGSGAAATHVDNFYLTGTVAGGCGDPFADADGDGDVDQSDFGLLQACFSGTGLSLIPGVCDCFDVQGANNLPDGDVDQLDMTIFEACTLTSGPDIPADKSCDDAVSPSPVQVVSAGSRRTHGAAGTFDLDIRLPSAVESREGGPQQIVFLFNEYVQPVDGSLDLGQEVTVSGGTVTDFALHCDELTINLSGVADGSCLSIGLSGIALVEDVTKVMPARTYTVAALWGDADGNGVVEQADRTLVQSNAGPANASNFRMDFDADGDVDTTDSFVPLGNLGQTASCP